MYLKVNGKIHCMVVIRNSLFLLISFMLISSKVLSISVDTDEKNNRYIVSAEKGNKYYFEKEYFYEPDVLASYKFSNNIVYVLQEMPHGNACDGGDIYIIWLNTQEQKNGKYKELMRKVDYCGGHSPKIGVQDGYVKIYFPPLKSTRWDENNPVFIPGSTWLFKPDWK